MDQTFDALLDFEKHSEIGYIGDVSLDNVIHFVPLRDVIPGIFLQLLDAQGKLVALLVNIQNNGLDLVPFFVNFPGMLDLVSP